MSDIPDKVDWGWVARRLGDLRNEVAIIALTVVVAFSMRGVDRQFKTLLLRIAP